MRVRDEEPGDEDAVCALHRAAFGGDHGETVARLVDDLRALEDGLSLVADDGGRVVGHALFTVSLLDAPARLVRVSVLSPLGVLPEAQNQGVGSTLVRRGLELLSEHGVPIVFLEGDPAYYSRFGFQAGTAHGFRRPSLRIPEPGFQAVMLPAYEPWMTGTLVYSEPFWRNDCVGLRD